MKPDVVNDYNENMRLIDNSDIQITSVHCLRKTKNWTRKIVFHLTNICLLKTGERSSLHLFNKKTITQLLERFGKLRSFESHPGQQ